MRDIRVDSCPTSITLPGFTNHLEEELLGTTVTRDLIISQIVPGFKKTEKIFTGIRMIITER
jgi:hypothetical protein